MYLLPWAWVFCLFSISHEHEYFIFFHAYFKHISAYFSSTKPDFDDTSPWFMILRWYFSLHFLEKSHFAKVLDINDIILYLSRRMIHWDFFREKTFLRERLSLSFVLQFSAERNNFFIKTSCYFIFLLYLCIGYRSKIRMVPKTLWVKTKAFAIISRLAKSVGISIWNNKHGNNMW